MSVWLVLLFGLAAVFALSRLKGGTRLTHEALAEKRAGGGQIVDVRSSAEFRSGAYPGARNIPLPELGSRLGDLQKDKPVVVYCASGARSAAAAGMLRQAGFKDVVNAGGLSQMPR